MHVEIPDSALFVDDGSERPVPAPGVAGEGRASGDGARPRDRGPWSARPGRSRPWQAVLDLEGLPELLAESLELEPAEGELIEMVLALERGVTLGLFRVEPSVEGLVVEQHRMIMDRVHRRQDAEEDAPRLEALLDRVQGLVDVRGHRASRSS